MKLHWAVQRNLTTPESYFGFVHAFEKLNTPNIGFFNDPKSDKLPDIPNDVPVMIYGAGYLVNKIYCLNKWNPGVLFTLDNFKVSTYLKNYGENLLNNNPIFTTLGQFQKMDFPMDREFFMRPDKDLKEFTGLKVKFKEIVEWDYTNDNRVRADANTEVVLCDPIPSKEIKYEWRITIVNKRASAYSQYKKDCILNVSAQVPQSVIDFSNLMAQMWSPEDVFVIDICEYKDSLWIVECNCFNCSGLYKSNILNIVNDINTLYDKGELCH